MKRLITIVLVLLLSCYHTFACTTFLINKNGQLVFGRNYDWVSGAGMVCSNLRGLQKTSIKNTDGTTISWISQYGSITFNQYGKEFPTGGMNEKGLVVELMWLDGTKYPVADNRPAVGVLQWIQYQLDCNSTVDQVIASDKTLRIASVENPPLHYLVADAAGNVATIEFLNGKMVVHKGKELPHPVLTNTSYKESVEKTKGQQSSSDNSLDRFAKACNMVQQYQLKDIKTSATDYAFDVLDKVSQGSWTKWSIVYDISNKKIQFKSEGFSTVKTVSFASFDFSCSSVTKMYNINQSGQGEISSTFINYSVEKNKPLLEAAIRESKDYVQITDKEKESILSYAREQKCK